jgi:3-deoxy-D-manno-octulosonate 8-phosphate phosphatase (KDO 8-P phosphatase)
VKSSELNAKLRRVRMVVLDCDGVLTDGTIYLDSAGRETKAFSVVDGSGIKYLQRAGIQVAILSGRSAKAVDYRAKELDIAFVYQGYKVKLDGLAKLIKRSGIPAEAICYLGDDLPDIPVMREVGLGIAVADARPEVRRMADWVARTEGGRGVVREVGERILKAQKKWGDIIARYGLKTGRNVRGSRS